MNTECNKVVKHLDVAKEQQLKKPKGNGRCRQWARAMFV